jgi:DNA polymerase III subunit epsilon
MASQFYSPQLEAFLKLVQRGKYVILDTETTGLHDGEICSIAIIDADGNTLLDQLVKPVHGIPADAQRVHGIDDAMVASAPGWAAVVPQVRQLISGRDVIVYNATYDRKMMHKSAEHAGIEKTEWKLLATWYCAMEAFAEMNGDWNSYRQSYTWKSLSYAVDYFDLELTNAHNALGDCLMTLGVIKAMVEHCGVK